MNETEDRIITAVVGIADRPTADHTIFTADALRAQHDGRRFFWDEQTKTLTWRGPQSELKDRRRKDV